GGGAVDIFSATGTLMKTFAQNGPTGQLKDPWGIAIAPGNFGKFSNMLLVGNVANGHINAYNLTTGKFVAALRDKSNKIFAVPGLWALTFGGGTASNGDTNQLFFLAGTDGYATGVFGRIDK